MLINDFFTIAGIRHDNAYIASLQLNPAHRVYKGHFPDFPVAPGVCLVQMVKETLENITGRKLFMESCSHIKFTAILDPNVNPDVTLTLQHADQGGGVHEASCTLSNGETKFLSLKGRYRDI
jgi:3-hydroxyacyl-[acyl-carrier-protein] dehydratase